MALRVLGIGALAAVAAATAFALLVVPADLNQGEPQRIMYLHVATAWLAYLSFGVTALASIWWLIRRDPRADASPWRGRGRGRLHRLHHLGRHDVGPTGVGDVLGLGRPAPDDHSRLLALYVGYLLIRRLTDEPARRATRAAIVGIIAAIDIPVVHFSVIWWRGLPGARPSGRRRRSSTRLRRAVRGRTAPHAGRVQPCLAVADDQPLSAGAPRVGCRGDRPPPRAARPDPASEPGS